jgi:RNA polymerase sigma-70 factor (ECF subfamily)
MTGPEASDAELLQELRHDPRAVGLLYDRYALRLVRFLEKGGASEQAALDAAQETFAKLVVQHRRLCPATDGTLWPWLAVTGRNLVRDWQRRRVVDARSRLRLGLPIPDDEADAVAVRADARTLRPRLRLALRRLSPEQRAAVTARVIHELDYPEIANATGASEQTVRRRVSRGLRAMQTFLEGGRS